MTYLICLVPDEVAPGPMDTGTSEADARDAHLWRSLDELLEKGVAPSVEDVLEHMAKLKRQAGLDNVPSKD